MTNISTLDDAKSSTRLCGDFNKMREEVIREVGENQNEVDRRLTERILPNFIIRLHMEKNREHYLEKKIEQFQEKKRKQNLEKKKEQYLKKALEKKKKKKRVAFRIVDPKKQFYSEKVNKNQEKEEEDSCKPKKQRKNPLEKEKSVVLRILPHKKRPLDQNQEIEGGGGGMSRNPKRQRKNPIEVKQMPTKFEDKIKGMQGSDIKLVIQKELTPSDLKANNNRLTIPSGQMKHEFLNKEEQVRLQDKEADGIHFKGMEVTLIEPGLQESTILLKEWQVGNTKPYVLSKPWIKVAERNKLKSSNTIQLWSFRVNESLHLALIKLDN